MTLVLLTVFRSLQANAYGPARVWCDISKLTHMMPAQAVHYGMLSVGWYLLPVRHSKCL